MEDAIHRRVKYMYACECASESGRRALPSSPQPPTSLHPSASHTQRHIPSIPSIIIIHLIEAYCGDPLLERSPPCATTELAACSRGAQLCYDASTDAIACGLQSSSKREAAVMETPNAWRPHFNDALCGTCAPCIMSIAMNIRVQR